MINFKKKASDSPEAAAFLANLLHTLTGVKLLHWMVKGPWSQARHEALGKYYDGAAGIIDTLAEEYFGTEAIIEVYPSQQYTPPNGNDPITFFVGVYAYIEANRGALGSASHIQNRIDELMGITAQTAYRLRYLA